MRIVLTIYLHSSLRETIVKHCNNLATWNPRQGSYDSYKGLHKTCQVLKRANCRKWRGVTNSKISEKFCCLYLYGYVKIGRQLKF